MSQRRSQSRFYSIITVLFAASMLASFIKPIAAAAVTLNVSRAAKVSFTFDDGLASSYTLAAPTLAKYGFAGTNYVTSGCIGMTAVPNNCAADNDVAYMSWANVSDLHTSYGWEIGSHTVNHPLLASTSEDQETALTVAQVTKELADSKAAIKANTGIEALAFASPYGDYNPSGNPVLSEVAKLYTSHRGFADTGYNVTPYNGGALPADNYPLNNYLIRTQQVQSGVSVADVKAYVDKAIADNSWLVLTFHEIKSRNASTDPEDYQYNNADLDLIAQYIKEKSVPVVTISDGLPAGQNNLVNGSFDTALGSNPKTEWNTDTATAFKNDTGNHGSYPGATNSISISATTVDAHLFSPIIIIDPTKNYILKIYVNITSIAAGDRKEIAFFIDEYDAAGNYLTTQYKKSIMAGDNPLVKDYVFEYTPTVNTGQARLQVNVTANSGVTGYLDSVEWYATDGTIPTPPVVEPPVDVTAPVISVVTGIASTTTSGVIGWITDEAATSQVEYGLTTAYGSTVTDETLQTVHATNLTGLAANTTYHYRVISKDAAGNVTTSEDYTFATPAIVIEPPVVAPLSGDINDDGYIDELDLSMVLSHWAQTGQTKATGDTNNDGVVDELDLSTVLANWSALQ